MAFGEGGDGVLGGGGGVFGEEGGVAGRGVLRVEGGGGGGAAQAGEGGEARGERFEFVGGCRHGGVLVLVNRSCGGR